jgi:hypothetical protein
MSGANDNEDDKPTVVLDLNALKKQKQRQEEELASLATELEFAVGDVAPAALKSKEISENFPVILFDFNSDLFEKSKKNFPQGYDYKIVKTLPELNQCLKEKTFQLLIFNYDANPKAVNQLCAQIKKKFPLTKTMIMAKAISPKAAEAHAKTPSGAHCYYQLPLNTEKIEEEFIKISSLKKVA